MFPDAEVLVQEEDTQALSEPIVKSVKVKEYDRRLKTEEFPPTSFTKEFLVGLMKLPDLIRNVAIAGHLHHGKTSFVQMLVDQTHENLSNIRKNVRLPPLSKFSSHSLVRASSRTRALTKSNVA